MLIGSIRRTFGLSSKPKIQPFQPSLRHHHQKSDDGFTLIELLIVILIIAILAAVGIMALLSALDSGKKSVAKSSLNTAVLAIKAAQAGSGHVDFRGLQVPSLDAGVAAMNGIEPDIHFVALEAGEGLGPSNPTNDIGVYAIPGSATNVILQSRDSSGHCFFIELHLNDATRYGSATNPGGSCPDTPAAPYTTSQANGWKAP